MPHNTTHLSSANHQYAYAGAKSLDQNSAESLNTNICFVSYLYSRVQETPCSKRVLVEAADPIAVDEKFIRFSELPTADGSNQYVLKSVAPAMRHDDAANDCQERGAEFQILRLCYQ